MKQGWIVLRKAIADGRMDVKDSRHGGNLYFVRQWLDYTRSEYPNKQPLLVIDNFHKLCGGGSGDERLRFKSMSQEIKRWCNQQLCTVIATMELSKSAPGIQATARDLIESSQMEYDIDLGIMIHNEFNDRRMLGETPKRAWYSGGEMQPIIDCDFQKNKISSFKSKISYEFDPAIARFKEIRYMDGELANASQYEPRSYHSSTR